MKGRVVFAAVSAALLMFLTFAHVGMSRAQQPPAAQQPKFTPIAKAPFTADATKETVIIRADWPANFSSAWHTHPGDEYGVVLEGSIISQIEGQEPKTITVGQSYHNPAGVVHIAKTGEQPAASIHVFVLEKGKPLMQPVTK